MPYDPGPVTIGDLRRDGKALENCCMNCDWHSYFDPHSLALPDMLPVPQTANQLRFSGCGFKNKPGTVMVWARASKHRVTEFPLGLVEQETTGN